MTDEQIREEKARRFKEMGIPTPIPQHQIQQAAASTVKNPSVLSTLEQIKRGFKKNEFQKVDNFDAAKAKNGNANSFQPISEQRPAPSQQQAYVKPVLQEKFDMPSTSGYNELVEAERMLNGSGGANGYYQEQPRYEVPQPQQYHSVEPDYDTSIYGPPPMDYRAKIAEKYQVKIPVKRHENPETQRQEASTLNNSVFMKKLNELEDRMQDMAIDVSERIALKLINEMTTDIAAEIAKKTAIETTKNIILEFAKKGKSILVESAKVKKAEVLSPDKVKIDGKIYKLTEIKA